MSFSVAEPRSTHWSTYPYCSCKYKTEPVSENRGQCVLRETDARRTGLVLVPADDQCP